MLLSTSAFLNLTELFEPEEASHVDLEGLRNLRHSLYKVTDQALSATAWDLSRSGSVGFLLKYGSGGSRDDEGRHLAVAVEATWTSKDILCACSPAEACLHAAGCSLQAIVKRPLEAVRAALGVTMADVFEILSATLRMRSRAVCQAVLYGPSACVVRMPGASWPLAVVRKTRSANWIFIRAGRPMGAATTLQRPPLRREVLHKALVLKTQTLTLAPMGAMALSGMITVVLKRARPIAR